MLKYLILLNLFIFNLYAVDKNLTCSDDSCSTNFIPEEQFEKVYNSSVNIGENNDQTINVDTNLFESPRSLRMSVNQEITSSQSVDLNVDLRPTSDNFNAADLIFISNMLNNINVNLDGFQGSFGKSASEICADNFISGNYGALANAEFEARRIDNPTLPNNKCVFSDIQYLQQNQFQCQQDGYQEISIDDPEVTVRRLRGKTKCLGVGFQDLCLSKTIEVTCTWKLKYLDPPNLRGSFSENPNDVEVKKFIISEAEFLDKKDRGLAKYLCNKLTKNEEESQPLQLVSNGAFTKDLRNWTGSDNTQWINSKVKLSDGPVLVPSSNASLVKLHQDWTEEVSFKINRNLQGTDSTNFIIEYLDLSADAQCRYDQPSRSILCKHRVPLGNFTNIKKDNFVRVKITDEDGNFNIYTIDLEYTVYNKNLSSYKAGRFIPACGECGYQGNNCSTSTSRGDGFDYNISYSSQCYRFCSFGFGGGSCDPPTASCTCQSAHASYACNGLYVDEYSKGALVATGGRSSSSQLHCYKGNCCTNDWDCAIQKDYPQYTALSFSRTSDNIRRKGACSKSRRRGTDLVYRVSISGRHFEGKMILERESGSSLLETQIATDQDREYRVRGVYYEPSEEFARSQINLKLIDTATNQEIVNQIYAPLSNEQRNNFDFTFIARSPQTKLEISNILASNPESVSSSVYVDNISIEEVSLNAGPSNPAKSGFIEIETEFQSDTQNSIARLRLNNNTAYSNDNINGSIIYEPGPTKNEFIFNFVPFQQNTDFYVWQRIAFGSSVGIDLDWNGEDVYVVPIGENLTLYNATSFQASDGWTYYRGEEVDVGSSFGIPQVYKIRRERESQANQKFYMIALNDNFRDISNDYNLKTNYQNINDVITDIDLLPNNTLVLFFTSEKVIQNDFQTNFKNKLKEIGATDANLNQLVNGSGYVLIGLKDNTGNSFTVDEQVFLPRSSGQIPGSITYSNSIYYPETNVIGAEGNGYFELASEPSFARTVPGYDAQNFELFEGSSWQLLYTGINQQCPLYYEKVGTNYLASHISYDDNDEQCDDVVISQDPEDVLVWSNIGFDRKLDFGTETLNCSINNCSIRSTVQNLELNFDQINTTSGVNGTQQGLGLLFLYDYNNINATANIGKAGRSGIDDLPVIEQDKLCVRVKDLNSEGEDSEFAGDPLVDFRIYKWQALKVLPSQDLGENPDDNGKRIYIFNKMDSSARYFLSKELL